MFLYILLIARICSEHFTAEDIHKPLQQVLLGYSPKKCRKLKEDAVPTQKLLRDKPDDTASARARSGRQAVRCRKSIIAEILSESKLNENQMNVQEEIVEERIKENESECRAKTLEEELRIKIGDLERQLAMFVAKLENANEKIRILEAKNKEAQRVLEKVFTPGQVSLTKKITYNRLYFFIKYILKSNCNKFDIEVKNVAFISKRT